MARERKPIPESSSVFEFRDTSVIGNGIYAKCAGLVSGGIQVLFEFFMIPPLRHGIFSYLSIITGPIYRISQNTFDCLRLSDFNLMRYQIDAISNWTYHGWQLGPT